MKGTAKAAQAFEDFTGRRPNRVKASRLDDRDVTGWELGPMVGAAYEATRDGKTQRYFHEFKKSARPTLVSRDDGKQLYIAGGKYKVTDRGIEDMPALFVVNPSSRKGRVTAKRRAKPMARRARKRRTSQVAIFRANPVRRRRRRSTGRRAIFARNPARRRRRSTAMTMRRNPIRRRRRTTVARRSYRRNPSGGVPRITKMLFPAMGIGAGAVVAEIVMAKLPIPASLKSGVLRHVTKGAVGVALGLAVGKFLRMKKLGNYMALGAVAIATHDFLKEMISSRVPGIGFGQYVTPVRSPFAGAGRGRIGYVSPASTVRMGQYTRPIASPFAGAMQAEGAEPGGETGFRA